MKGIHGIVLGIVLLLAAVWGILITQAYAPHWTTTVWRGDASHEEQGYVWWAWGICITLIMLTILGMILIVHAIE